jgi:hypothetical protein
MPRHHRPICSKTNAAWIGAGFGAALGGITALVIRRARKAMGHDVMAPVLSGATGAAIGAVAIGSLAAVTSSCAADSDHHYPRLPPYAVR